MSDQYQDMSEKPDELIFTFADSQLADVIEAITKPLPGEVTVTAAELHYLLTCVNQGRQWQPVWTNKDKLDNAMLALSAVLHWAQDKLAEQ